MAVVTIARELGSGGDDIGALVAEQLSYQLVDRRLVQEIASTTGSTLEEVERFDEKGEGRVRFFLRRLLVPQFHADSLPLPSRGPLPEFGLEFPSALGEAVATGGHCLDRGTYQLLITTLVQDAGAIGNAVVVGRASQVILAGLGGTVHVKVIAPPGLRIEQVMASQAVTREVAARLVEQHDRWRQLYLRNAYGVDWDDPLLYDLTINTGRVSQVDAVAAITHLVRRRPLPSTRGAVAPAVGSVGG